MTILDILKEWKEPVGVIEWGQSPENAASPAWDYYINVNMHPDDMVVLFRMIFPAVVSVADCTLLQFKADGHSQENIVRFKSQAGGAEKFEKQFNIVRMYDLFSHQDVKYESSFEQAALLLRQSWDFTLCKILPSKTFEVLVSNTDRDYGPTITFFEKR